VNEWCTFLEDKHLKAVSKDIWEQFYEFISTINDDFDNHDYDSAWPVVIDDFVEFMKSSK
jgi:DCN1-like protein 1/2